MKYILNYENVEYLKENINIFYNSISNKDIINDLFDDDVEFEINDIDDELNKLSIKILSNDELIINKLNHHHFKRFDNKYDLNNYINDEIDELIDIKKDNYIVELLLIICIINYYKGSINKNVYNKLNDELLKRFDKTFINYLYQYSLKHDIFLNDEFEYVDDIDNDIDNVYVDNVEFINKFLIDEFDYELLNHDNKKSYDHNYIEIIDSIIIYDDKYDVVDSIIECYDIHEFLKNYIDIDRLYDDIIDDYSYYEYENKIIHQYYF